MGKNRKGEGRGGARPGSGRKPSGREMVSISLRLPVEAADKLRGMSKSQERPIWRVLEDLIAK